MDFIHPRTNTKESKSQKSYERDIALSYFQADSLALANSQAHIDDIELSFDYIAPKQKDSQESKTHKHKIIKAPMSEYQSQLRAIDALNSLLKLGKGLLGKPISYQNPTNYNNSIIRFSAEALKLLEDANLSADDYQKAIELYEKIIHEAAIYRDEFTKEMKRKSIQSYADSLKRLMWIFTEGSTIYITTKAMYESAMYQLNML